MDKTDSKIELEPIGWYESVDGAEYKFSVPRQGIFRGGRAGVIRLKRGMGFEDGVRDVDGFERIWVIFVFDRNRGWRPTVRPPIPPRDHERVGVFASRSPYRPNPIGLSSIRLIRVEGLSLYVDESDLLDGTPILDIKPYLAKADAFPEAKAGWVDEQCVDAWMVRVGEKARLQGESIVLFGGPDVLSIAAIHLGENPLDGTRKRVERVDERRGVLSIRMFRIDFVMDAVAREIEIEQIRSGYSEEELQDREGDVYGDKELHRALVVNKNLISCR